MKAWKRALAPALVGALVGWSQLASGAGAVIDPNLYLNDIKYLASKELKGRLTGSPELEKAAGFIATQFREFGLQPVHGKSYYQPFEAVTAARLGSANRLRVTVAGHTVSLRLTQDFTPLFFSSAGKISSGVVFAGYGITAADLHYDDYAGLDVKGKLVLILRHEPQEADEHSVFDGKQLTGHALFSSKASNAKMHGAAGVILIDDTPNHPGQADDLPKFAGEDGPDDAGIPFVQVKAAETAPWFAAAGKNLDQVSAAIDKDLKPQSFAFPASLQVDLQVDIERQKKTVHNVEGYLPGETGEYVVIGAHYDHLGLGGAYSLAPGMTGTIHPGADDNASGTAGVIELARWFARQPKQKRGILFLTFAGEEEGLLGSAWYVQHPDLPLDRAVAMINMDMIGRVRDGKIYVGGSDTGTTLRALMDQVSAAISAARGLFGQLGLRIERPHVFYHRQGAGAVFLLRAAQRLPQAQRHLGQDRRAGCREGAATGGGSDRGSARERRGGRNSCAWPRRWATEAAMRGR